MIEGRWYQIERAGRRVIFALVRDMALGDVRVLNIGGSRPPAHTSPADYYGAKFGRCEEMTEAEERAVLADIEWAATATRVTA